MLNLPGHIVKKSDKWYFNTKTSKYISADYIVVWLENYWKYHTPDSVTTKAKYKKLVKDASRRWDDGL